jgi:hypothetical protein
MNAQNPAIPPTEAGALPAFKDRSTGLLIFGILTILLGCLCGLLALVMLGGQAAAARATHTAAAPVSAFLPALLVYGVLAVALIWLGIGSIMARRWARALLLIFSWSWLVMGVFMTAVMPFVMAKVMANLPANTQNGQAEMPPAAIAGMIVFLVLFSGVFFVVVPAVWVFFYKSRHVKATCETRDPVPRWTDACPLPVLAACMWLLFSAPMMLVVPLMGHGVMPFFGMYLTGLPGTFLCLALAALWAYAARLLYKLDVRGWWLFLIVTVLSMVSAMLTYAQHDMVEMYQLMGYPQAQIEQIQKTGLLTGHRMEWLMSLCMLPFLGYILFIKKYLRGKQ